MANTRLLALAGAGVAGLAAASYYYKQHKQPAEWAMDPAQLKNQAFVFVKPHAATASVEKYVREQLQARGVKVLEEGDLTADVIDQKKLIDQHYYAIASKATILKPEQLSVPKDKFQSFFGQSWDEALAQKKVFNALDATKELGISASEMAQLWAQAKKQNKLVKFGGGFYCGEVNYKGRKLYVFNGFFMEMRSAFTAPGGKIHYYNVEWDPKTLPWADFRGKLLGPTDPKDAPSDSLRGSILRSWRDMGLKAEPNVGDNAVHASASPFEGMAERMNWLGVPCQKDPLCRTLVGSGIPEEVIREWSRDPQVVVEPGKKKSLFDTLEDMDVDKVVAKAKELARLQTQK